MHQEEWQKSWYLEEWSSMQTSLHPPCMWVNFRLRRRGSQKAVGWQEEQQAARGSYYPTAAKADRKPEPKPGHPGSHLLSPLTPHPGDFGKIIHLSKPSFVHSKMERTMAPLLVTWRITWNDTGTCFIRLFIDKAYFHFNKDLLREATQGQRWQTPKSQVLGFKF